MASPGVRAPVALSTGHVDVLDVELLPRLDRPALAVVGRVRRRGEANLGERAAYGGFQVLTTHVAGWRDDRFRAVGVVAVEADQGVVVDGAAYVELVDLQVAPTQ